jgi:hypothetical protein
VVITLVFAAMASHHQGDPFAKHLSPDQQDAAVSAFRAAIAVAAGLCIAGTLVALKWIPGREDANREVG